MLSLCSIVVAVAIVVVAAALAEAAQQQETALETLQFRLKHVYRYEVPVVLPPPVLSFQQSLRDYWHRFFSQSAVIREDRRILARKNVAREDSDRALAEMQHWLANIMDKSFAAASHKDPETARRELLAQIFGRAPVQASENVSPALHLRAKPFHLDRSANQTLLRPQATFENAFESRYEPLLHSSANTWDARPLVPDVSDRATVIAIASATSNAYTLPGNNDWIPLDPAWRRTISFGWETDGIRGHIFSSGDDDSVLMIALKGTSPIILGRGGPSSERDRINDNLMFSCCCGKFSNTWAPVCDCYKGQNPETKAQQCSAACVQDSLHFSESYYNIARKIYNDVRLLYPHAQIWFVGHSLGGAVASLMALTTGFPAVPFQAPGDLLYAKRLGFQFTAPSRQSYNLAQLPIFHFGNTADPVFNGKCTGPWSSCYYGGYAMESKCHIAHQCVFQVPSGKLDIRYHRIAVVLEKLLLPNEDLPECQPVQYAPTDAPQTGKEKGEEEECRDCDIWEFV